MAMGGLLSERAFEIVDALLGELATLFPD